MNFILLPLPYENDALEPTSSASTVCINYSKRDKACVDNLNKVWEMRSRKCGKEMKSRFSLSEGGTVSQLQSKKGNGVRYGVANRYPYFKLARNPEATESLRIQHRQQLNLTSNLRLVSLQCWPIEQVVSSTRPSKVVALVSYRLMLGLAGTSAIKHSKPKRWLVDLLLNHSDPHHYDAACSAYDIWLSRERNRISKLFS
jgi:Iron/manganese superoxide dismutases, alpha-hairpin domain